MIIFAPYDIRTIEGFKGPRLRPKEVSLTTIANV
jgi:hypothetical protein